MLRILLGLLIANVLFGAYIRDNVTQTVYDTQRDLTWQDNAMNTTMDWSSALSYCENLSFVGKDDWRLPSIEELRFIVDTNRSNPASDASFQTITSSYYWSSSVSNVNQAYDSYGFGINFANGTEFLSTKSFPSYVRCVRSGSLSATYPSQTVVITGGWNLISVPFHTDEEFELNTLLNGKATIAWKFNVSNEGEYSWEKWLPGQSLKMKNGDGIFVGVPSGASHVSFSGALAQNSVTFATQNYRKDKWYLVGFGYDMSVGDIKAMYPMSVVWIWENGAYKKLNDSDVIKAGQGFWFKYQ